ncbi:MAG: ATP phosphoribosyltransferase regulatory subunit, partial [Lachnospiraceae bacterium]|nr:ATP phosphoribosyltransferase regulatory subunit [Lachnospiraceae bacterium]
LVDGGLRYDLTLPLSRYYANHKNDLPQPFKALQMGSVFRADRPQKGRFRQFVQCDIDILGDPSNLAEIELILATTTLLSRLSFRDFTVRINDRRILKAMASCAGFLEEDYDTVFIILDKMDKIGKEGVEEELVKSGFSQEQATRYLSLFSGAQGEEGLEELAEKLQGHLEEDCISGLSMIMETVSKLRATDFRIAFDPTLVRGMSYYTGTIFEICTEGFSSSIAGGGRYDEMIGRFTGQKTPACGFSIGFERIITILMDNDFQVPGTSDKVAFLIEKGADADRICAVMKEAEALRAEGKQVLVSWMNKNKKFQKEQLQKEGYPAENIRDFYHTALKE